MCIEGTLIASILLMAALLPAMARAASACGEVVTLASHDRTTLRYALARPADRPADARPTTLVLLAGGGGYLNLDGAGCPRALKGNSLVRSVPLFHKVGFVIALVDAPSDHTGDDGLGGFRTAPAHAADLGLVVADLRARIGGPVWVVGTSRGTISAVNAAARLSGPAAPDGVVLTSALTAGQSNARKAWVADSVFDLPLESIRLPLLVIGHAADACALARHPDAEARGPYQQRPPAGGDGRGRPGRIRAIQPRGLRGPVAARLHRTGSRSRRRHRPFHPRRAVLRG